MSDFLDIYDKVAVVKKANFLNVLVPGFEINITMSGKLNDGTVVQGKTLFMISKSEIVAKIYYKNANTSVQFNETMQLDCKGSYDLDYPK